MLIFQRSWVRNAQSCFLGYTSAGSRSRRQHGYCGPRGGSNEKIYCKASGQSREESFGSKIELLTAAACRLPNGKLLTHPGLAGCSEHRGLVRRLRDVGGIVIGGGRRYGAI